MTSNKCIGCAELKRCRESSVSLIFFIIGIISTIAVRVVTVLAHLEPVYGEIAWYVGVSGFFIYFIYKYKTDRDRYRLIMQRQLMDKIAGNGQIVEEDRKLLSMILCALSSNKDRINYFFIFFSSAIAILIAVYYDFIRR